uniref:Uncharacterized protein n=1 Tax=Romanomermis culicivorax TaxID=13658 RepID=A0A915JTT5_ROMCU
METNGQLIFNKSKDNDYILADMEHENHLMHVKPQYKIHFFNKNTGKEIYWTIGKLRRMNIICVQTLGDDCYEPHQ